MNAKKKLKKLRSLIHEFDIHVGRYAKDFGLIQHLDKKIEEHNYDSKYCIETRTGFLAIKKLVLDLGITKDEYFQISIEECKKVYETRELLSLNNLKETRDNKGVYVGSGNSNRHKIRLPKKNRSKKTWKIFYEMFPSMKPKK